MVVCILYIHLTKKEGRMDYYTKEGEGEGRERERDGDWERKAKYN